MKKNIDMLNGPIFSSVLRFAFPIIATGILQILYNNADIIIVGQFSSAVNAVGAIGATTAIIHLIVNLFLGVSVGTNVALAQSVGRGDDAGSKKLVHSAVALSLISGAIITAIGLGLSSNLLTLMNTPEDIFDQSLLYLQIYFLGMPASMVYNFGSAILRAKGDTKRPLIILSSSGLINVLLNLFFVIGFDMGVDGVAWATTISQYLAAIAIIVVLIKETGCFRLELKSFKLSAKESLLILRYGIPAGLTSIMFSISNIFIQTALNSYDNAALLDGSAASAGLEGIVYTSINAFGQASLTFVGQNYGAQNYKRIPKIFAICTAISVTLGLGIGSLMYAFGTPLLKLYLPTATAQTIEFGLTRMMCIMLTQFIACIMEVQIGVIRGIGYSTIPSIVTILTICVFRIVWIFTLYPIVGTLESLFICYPISWILSVAVLQIVYRVVYKKELNKTQIYKEVQD